MKYHVESINSYWAELMPEPENGICWASREFPLPDLPEDLRVGDVVEFSAVIVERGPETEEE